MKFDSSKATNLSGRINHPWATKRNNTIEGLIEGRFTTKYGYAYRIKLSSPCEIDSEDGTKTANAGEVVNLSPVTAMRDGMETAFNLGKKVMVQAHFGDFVASKSGQEYVEATVNAYTTDESPSSNENVPF